MFNGRILDKVPIPLYSFSNETGVSKKLSDRFKFLFCKKHCLNEFKSSLINEKSKYK